MKNFGEMTAEELHNFRVELEKKVAEFSAAVNDYVQAVEKMNKAADTYGNLLEKNYNELDKILA